MNMATSKIKRPYAHMEKVTDFFTATPHVDCDVYRSGDIFYLVGVISGEIGSGWVTCGLFNTAKYALQTRQVATAGVNGAQFAHITISDTGITRYRPDDTPLGFEFFAVLYCKEV